MRGLKEYMKGVEGVGGVRIEGMKCVGSELLGYERGKGGEMEWMVEGIDGVVNKKLKEVMMEGGSGVGKWVMGSRMDKVVGDLVVEEKGYGELGRCMRRGRKGLEDEYGGEKGVVIEMVKGKKK